jgi:DNA-binding transcriptional MerR regulator
MKSRVKIGDFVKLTGSTLKTVLYYHKIGLLQEPERSLGGYRLYGSAELSRMQFIKHLKYLGLDLKRIKEILGDINDHKTLREVLQSSREELLSKKKNIEERVVKIDRLLSEDNVSLDDDSSSSSSFQMISEILAPDQIEEYALTCPELFAQQRKLFGILDDFQWGEDYQVTFRALAEFFKAHPQQYQISLDYGVRLARLAQLPEDDPEVDALARASAEFIKKIPQLKEILGQQPGIKKPLAPLFNDLAANVISPAQVKHGQLLQQYLSLGDCQSQDCENPDFDQDHKNSR